MKRIAIFILSLAAAAFLIVNCGGGLTATSGKTLVSVNGKKITDGDLEFLGDINPRIGAQLATPMGKKKILDNLIEQELLYQEAVKKGINRDPEVRAKAELYRRVIVAQALLDKEIDTSAKKYYDENQDEFKKLRMSQILIRYEPDPKKRKKVRGKVQPHSEQEALKLTNKALEKINKGEDFAEVAKKMSEDAATKNRGGDMGPVSKDDQRFIARGYGPLVEKSFEMKVGEVAGPIKTEKGYHLIAVTRGAELEPLDNAKRAILFKIRNNVRSSLIDELKKEGNVTFAAELEPKTKPKIAVPTKPAQPEKPAEPEKVKEIPKAEKK
jgi:peptidyl-prolyl cis-trans isomerase C